ncbi:J domain-containing protein [Synechococcus sp. Cruz-9H2]|uniref:J domain-containing protein n=1 Tax=unclassified Synechococcus TaxID=2626047 RepID=UPI0020CE6351|nr:MULTISPECIES: J domain-containing protein [unclassified Synechococcus]MCP9819071.1 J domain-containing protein [Synechococcus sp. Cruz-9H2]MCP9843575.1 J domain-containing protein [Synechococcus sp. Edmonson 11F2]MCP9855706.1 J domain-containing protein [Synechococcus sp. Cruz-9C9]MCP9863144.1 J domain-containing protein [Synechococcus sp. Cruz-7E5]MCP9869981.1 J domain-containing protein [Synechococcus sp. Cruz-7B9]
MAGGEHPVTGPSLYALLGLPSTATAQDLRQAFRSLSKLYHPDTTTLPLAEARDQFRLLQEAYLVLGDPQRRSAYDSQLRLALLQRVQALSPPTATPAPGPGPMLPGPLSPRRPLSVRRAFSGGEWFALVLLALALLFSLVLGLGLAWWRGVELVTQPPGSGPAADPIERQTEGSIARLPGDDLLTPPADSALQPPTSGS